MDNTLAPPTPRKKMPKLTNDANLLKIYLYQKEKNRKPIFKWQYIWQAIDFHTSDMVLIFILYGIPQISTIFQLKSLGLLFVFFGEMNRQIQAHLNSDYVEEKYESDFKTMLPFYSNQVKTLYKL